MPRKSTPVPHTEEFTILRRPGWSFLGAIAVTIECDPGAAHSVKLGLAVSAAYRSGASLVGARLDGALVRGEKVSRLLASANRLADPYTFYAFELASGGVKVLAGCRWFTIPEYRAHVAGCYADTPKGFETLDILDFFEVRCRRLDAPLEPPIAAEAA